MLWTNGTLEASLSSCCRVLSRFRWRQPHFGGCLWLWPGETNSCIRSRDQERGFARRHPRLCFSGAQVWSRPFFRGSFKSLWSASITESDILASPRDNCQAKGQAQILDKGMPRAAWRKRMVLRFLANYLRWEKSWQTESGLFHKQFNWQLAMLLTSKKQHMFSINKKLLFFPSAFPSWNLLPLVCITNLEKFSLLIQMHLMNSRLPWYWHTDQL